MTEEEAKQRWCPFASSRVVQQPLGGTDNKIHSFNSDDGEVHTTCLGSACMAWRWYKDNRQEIGECEIDAPERGYCGLAGKP